MFLLIDAGNSRLKFGCHDGTQWLLRDFMDSPRDLWQMLPEGIRPDRVLVSCVAGVETAEMLREELAVCDAAIEFLHPNEQRGGLRNTYQPPQSLGADRWAAAIGAWHLIHDDCLVVGSGTATTIDIIRANGEFAGGCILPGLSLMLDALAYRTAALPRASADMSPTSLFEVPRNTLQAISAGCVHAQLGAIERMHRQLPPSAPILLAGGNAEWLAPHLGPQAEMHPWLVMEGLLALARNAVNQTAPEKS